MKRLTTRTYSTPLLVLGLVAGACGDAVRPELETWAPSLLVAPGSGTWATRAPMTVARQDLGAASVNGVLYAVGGINSSFLTLQTLEAYNPGTNTWLTRAPMPTPRRRFGVGVIDGVIYVVGGLNAAQQALQTVEAYDPATNTWSTKASMPTARQGLAVGVIDGVLYAVGGAAPSPAAPTAVEAYDPTTNTWTTKAPMPTGRAFLAAGVVNGVLYAVGGTGSSASKVEAYDPATNTWTTKAPLPTPRASLSAGTIDGILYAVGGFFQPCCSPGAVPTVEAYEPATDTWTAVASMPTAREALAASVADGVLYALGGRLGSFLPTVEAFTPAPTAEPQAITFTSAAPDPGIVGETYTPSATGGGSGNPVTFTSLTPDVCTVADGTVHFAAAGVCTVAGDQAASAGYLAAPQVTQAIDVTNRPLAAGAPPPQATEGSTITFDGGASSDPDGDRIATYMWDFGDGSAITVNTPTVEHTYADDLAGAAAYSVILTVTDAKGAPSLPATITVDVNNVAPVVASIPGASLIQRESYSAAGSFTDPGADAWSATVNYGTSGGPQPLDLAGMSFALSSQYRTPGSFTIAVLVTDDDGGMGAAQATVVVQSFRDAIYDLLVRSVDALVAAGQLTATEGAKLKAKITVFLDRYRSVDLGLYSTQVTLALRSYISYVRNLVTQGKLSAAAGDALIEGAERIIVAINTP